MSTHTPQRLFLLYASPCMDGRHMQRDMGDANFETLVALLDGGGQPPETLLEECFPNAVRSLTEYAQANGLPVWSDAAVASYWRDHHKGESPVTRGIVLFPKLGMYGNKVEVAQHSDDKGDDESVVALNALDLSLEAGDEVTMHNNVIIEKLPK